MSKILSDYITKHREAIGDNRPVPQIVCKDGLRISVQAHHGAYSTPRENKGPWVKFEVGFPSERVEELMPFAEEAERPTSTVYGYVPGEIIGSCDRQTRRHSRLTFRTRKGSVPRQFRRVSLVN